MPLIPGGVNAVWEPCYGKGRIYNYLAALKNADGSPRYRLVGTDKFEPAPDGKADLLDAPLPPGVEMIVTNTPWGDKVAVLEALNKKGVPWLALFPVSMLSGVGTSALLKTCDAKFFIFNGRVLFRHDATEMSVGGVMWVAVGACFSHLPALNWLVVPKAPKAKSDVDDRAIALQIALADAKADRDFGLNLLLADMTDTVLPVHIPVGDLLKPIELPPVPLGGDGYINVLELCSGTCSFSKGAKVVYGDRLGAAITVEMDAAFAPTHAVDILKWDYRAYPRGSFQIIWASPPCREFSAMRPSTGKVRDLCHGDRIVAKCLEIIAYFQPKIYFVENPYKAALLPARMPLIKQRMGDMGFAVPPLREYVVADYCCYETPYQKPTVIWSNAVLALKTCPGFPACPSMLETTVTEEGKTSKKQHHRATIGNYSTIYEKVPVAMVATVPQPLIASILTQTRL